MLLSDVGKMLNVACKGDCEFEGFAIDSRAVKKGNMTIKLATAGRICVVTDRSYPDKNLINGLLPLRKTS